MNDQFTERAQDKERKEKIPQVRYTSASEGPANCKRAPAPKNSPVPMEPPMAIIYTWRLLMLF